MADFTYEEAMTALRNADASGNAEDAKKLAVIADRLKPQSPVAGSEPLPSTGERLQRMGTAALRGAATGGPLGMTVGMGIEGMGQFGQATDRLAHKAGEVVSQAVAKTPLPAEVAGAAGYLTNLGVQAVPTFLGGGLGKAAAPLLESKGESLMYSALKPHSSLGPEKSAKAVNTMLTTDVGNWLPGANVTAGGIKQIQTKIRELGQKVDDILTNVTAQPNPPQVSQISVVNALNKPTQKFANQVTPAADLEAIRKVEDEFLKTYPALMPIKEAHDLKKGTYAVLGDKAYSGELKSADMEAQKALASGLRAETEKGAPGIAPLNKEQSDLINAVKAAISRDAVAQRKNPVGLGFLASHPVAAIAFMADRSEIIKSLLARVIYNGAKPVATGAGASIGAAGGAYSGREE